MSTRYFVHHNGSHVGPFTSADIEGRFQRLDLTAADFVFDQERGDWIPIGDFLLGQKQKTPISVASESQRRPLLPQAPAQTPVKPKASQAAQKKTPPPRLPLPPLPPPPNFSPQNPSYPRPAKQTLLDLAARGVLDVKPPNTLHFSFEFTGEARVGEMVQIIVKALNEENQVDSSFQQELSLECDQPLSGLGPLRFRQGVARMEVICLNSGRHQFQLLPPRPQVEEGGPYAESLELLNSRMVQ